MSARPSSGRAIDGDREGSVEAPFGRLAVPPRATLGELAYAQLRESIITTRLLPGRQVSENELAEATGTSRTPIREAIRRLVEDGLVDVSPQYGTRVSRIGVQRVRESVFVRQAVECAVLVAAGPFRPEGIAALAAENDAMRRTIAAGDAAASSDGDERFHARLMEACGCASAVSATRAISADIVRIRFLAGADRQYFRGVLADHERLVEHLRAGRRNEAVDLLRRHLLGFAVDQEALQAHATDLFAP